MRASLLVLFLGAVPMARAADLDKLLEKRTHGEGKSALPYRLPHPLDHDAAKEYPLVIFLHGMGERGTDNKKQLVHGVKEFAKDENRKKHPCFFIAPQCPTTSTWSAFRGGFKEEPTPPAKQVLEVIAALRKEFKIDSKRIYLTGLSMGGFGTFDLLAREPGLFAAAVPICGGGDPKTAERFAKVPLWVFHGDKDAQVKPEQSRRMVDAVKKAGGEPKYTEYKGSATTRGPRRTRTRR
ncbi:MAG: prolyl oligopeptidase family serine peptidase [Gemmataceae bacterium]|nr:prolyl oligopeptidase family serine peptidase [Gemmataceae bacterium]